MPERPNPEPVRIFPVNNLPEDELNRYCDILAFVDRLWLVQIRRGIRNIGWMTALLYMKQILMKIIEVGTQRWSEEGQNHLERYVIEWQNVSNEYLELLRR